ncbi:DNA mismatch repair endonuclease MutL [Pediococcus argentinicus]|uniref:DNA mismatch repair protein MutL n=1 Tax=Pediococcus argentinicus TaxID=480391 RepID=A0A0R2NMN7_9LACO|nr:DNA mismatch repair endonuclease MutL [Pediococcus argentinicus]KRO25277.1 mutL protein [Pediococcus argentinicus]NKZ22344.1 DNA mismatch repair endonuclease MutL [Pediococcus argentinicus]GEP19433.1 DNA mismatch repair protein MutL [Pediococcus argentinicus]
MAQIHELSEILSDQIAAGEVVERPASVVKELVENAVDAGSDRIDILLEEAGLKSIRVIDNGQGINSDEVQIAFRRHATSKISSREDLFKVATLGFRGEALPSIASIADVVLTTSTGSGVGQKVHYRGGDLVDQNETSIRQGTDVLVTDLFFNTPARLKYLKSVQTELSKITDIVNRIALSYPDISFSLNHDGRELLRTTGRGDLLQVISNIYGVQNARKMEHIQGQNVDFEVEGYISLPELTRASRNYISVLLNGRYIKNYAISKAIISGYGSKLMVGRYPMAVINIKMDPLLVDVNVHPTKQEVRISQEPSLTNLISKSIYDQLAQENLIPDAIQNLKGRDKAIVPVKNEQMNLDQSTVLDQAVQLEEPSESFSTDSDNEISEEQTPIIIKSRSDLADNSLKEFKAKYRDGNAPTFTPSIRSVGEDSQESAPSSKRRFPELLYIGQMHGTYLFAESSDGLYIVDQHAAQERINYEYYRVAVGQVDDNQQDLLVPIYLNYSSSDTLKIEEHQDVLANVGLHLEPFGKNTFIVRQHPAWFKAGQEEDTIREMVDYVIKDGIVSVAKFREASAIMMSCKRAIKANHHLDDAQAKQLLRDLSQTENPFNCPHGRPVLVHFSTNDMEKMFKRIQDPHHTDVLGD